MTKQVCFTPLRDKLLIRRIEQEGKTSGGIIIPETAKEKPMEGEVVASGPGKRDDNGNLIPMQVKVGDKILFAKWGGAEVKLNSEEFIILKESDILGVLS